MDTLFQLVLSYKIDKKFLNFEDKTQRRELFKIRFSHYEFINQFIFEVITKGTISRKDISKISYIRKQCSFVFGQEILSFIDELILNSNMLVNIGEATTHDEKIRKMELLQWYDDAYNQLEIKFKKYLFLND